MHLQHSVATCSCVVGVNTDGQTATTSTLIKWIRRSPRTDLCVATVDLLKLSLASFLHLADLALQLTLPQLSLQLKLANIEVD